MASVTHESGGSLRLLVKAYHSVSGGTWLMALGGTALAIPTLISLSDQSWSQESGAHGPIILFTGAWLLWRKRATFKLEGRPGYLPAVLVALFVGVTLNLAGRMSDLVTLDASGLYLAGLALALGSVGFSLMLRNWFPFLYFVFAIPPPALLLARITLPLKGFVSEAATALLSNLGLPVSHEGVTIFVAQYQLLVEDACSGMNSLIGLSAISLLYIYLRHGSSLYRAATLIVLIIPIAILANIIRIIILILMTYTFGDETAQGILHPVAGLLLFASALALIFGFDELISRTVFSRRRER